MSKGGWMHDDVTVFNSGAEVCKYNDPENQFTIDGPAVVLMDPKYPHNVGQAVRLCSCYGIPSLVVTGRRVPLRPEVGYRLPREERMKGYKDVTIYSTQRPFDLFVEGTKFVAVEVRENAESLPMFGHPENAVYVFGPEDGSLGRPSLVNCHRFVVLPTKHCLNLATAVGTVLYDRQSKQLRGEMK